MLSPNKTQNNQSYFQGGGKIQIWGGVKEIHLGERLNFAIILLSEYIQVVDLMHSCVLTKIKHGYCFPKHAQLARNQQFFAGQFTDNSISIYDVKSGKMISRIMGVPTSVTTFFISQNSQKLLYGNNHTLCVWNISKNKIQMATQQWRNINCFAISHDGKQFAIGTYSGEIFLLTQIEDNKISQITIKRHTKCVMHIAFIRKGQLASVSYDKILLYSTLGESDGQRCLKFSQFQIQTIPRSIVSTGGTVFLVELQAIFWLEGRKLRGFADGTYAVTNTKRGLAFARYNQGVMEWFYV